MDTSDSEQEEPSSRRNETMITTFNLLYSPCHICKVFLNTILKCLGYDFPRYEPTNSPTRDTQTETEMKSNEDVGGGGDLSSRTATSARSRPTRPPISSGRDGQIN